MKLRFHTVLQRAIEEGVAHGWRRAHKHTDTPDFGAVQDAIRSAIMLEVDTFFDLGEEDEREVPSRERVVLELVRTVLETHKDLVVVRPDPKTVVDYVERLADEIVRRRR